MSEPEAEGLSQDLVFDLLSNPRRRFILSYLRQRGEPVELSELTEQIAAWENDVDVSELSDRQTKRVYVSIYQTHIPKLEDAGVVHYDSDSGRVSLTDQATRIDDFLPSTQRERPWHQYYLVLAIGAIALYASSLVVDFITPAIASLVIIASFALVTVAHYMEARVRNRPQTEIEPTREEQ